MEKIINDSFYDQCRKFIQDHIQDEFINEEIRAALINIYNSLTPEDSKQFLGVATRLVMGAANKATRDLEIGFMKTSGIIILGGLIAQSLRLVKYNNAADAGLLISGVGVIMFLSVGH